MDETSGFSTIKYFCVDRLHFSLEKVFPQNSCPALVNFSCFIWDHQNDRINVRQRRWGFSMCYCILVLNWTDCPALYETPPRCLGECTMGANSCTKFLCCSSHDYLSVFECFLLSPWYRLLCRPESPRPQNIWDFSAFTLSSPFPSESWYNS